MHRGRLCVLLPEEAHYNTLLKDILKVSIHSAMKTEFRQTPPKMSL